MTHTLRQSYQETRARLTRAQLETARQLSATFATLRRMELARVPNGPPPRAERRAAITNKHRGLV
jgi:hypothetical protein